MKPRKKNKEDSGKLQQYREGRTYEDFLAFTLVNPDIPVVQMDTVHGTRTGKVIMTLFFRNTFRWSFCRAKTSVFMVSLRKLYTYINEFGSFYCDEKTAFSFATAG